MPPVTFNLKLGMRDEELLGELRGRVSGETAAETQVLFDKTKKEGYPLPLVEVLKLDEVRETAIIRKNHFQIDKLGGLTITTVYFIVGMNDEGAYYAHSLSASDIEAHTHPESNTLEALLMWMNRADQGFTRRIQGDVLAQTVQLQPHSSPSERVPVILADGKVVNFEPYSPSGKAPVVMNLGNHRVIAEGGILAGGHFDDWGDPILCGPPQVILEHPQHGRVLEHISQGSGVILAGQRGRYTSVSGSPTAGYD